MTLEPLPCVADRDWPSQRLAVAIEVQSLGAVLGMVPFLWWVPKHLFPPAMPGRARVAH